MNKMLSCAGADSLQTGVRGAFGEPQGTVARGRIGQVIVFVGTKRQNKEHVTGTTHKAKFKFSGTRRFMSPGSGALLSLMSMSLNLVENQLIPDGSGVGYIPNRTPGQMADPRTPESLRTTPTLHLPINPTSCRETKEVFLLKRQRSKV